MNLNNLTEKSLRQSVIESYDIIAKDWDVTRQNNWPEFNLLKGKIPDGSKVLDLGCGNGRLYSFLKDNFKVDYTGIDNSRELIKIARQNNPAAKFEVGDALNLPFAGQSFDFVISLAVLHHLPGRKNRLKFLSEVYRVLAPNGKAFITVWNLYQPNYKKYLTDHIWLKLWHHLKAPFNPLFGLKDAFIPFGQEKVLRYVHAFTPSEIRSLSERSSFKIEEEIFSKKDRPVKKWQEAFNLCFLLKKR